MRLNHNSSGVRLYLVHPGGEYDNLLKENLEKEGYEVVPAHFGKSILKTIKNFQPSVILLDILSETGEGIGIFRNIRKSFPEIPVIILADQSVVTTVVDCIKEGAYDFLTRPINFGRFSLSVRNAVEYSRLSYRCSTLETMHEPCQFDDIIGVSPQMQTIYQIIRNVSRTDATVFIMGESGTGKELVARAIHNHSRRVSKRMVAINCAAIPQELLESELFGHEKGAFTGAYKSQPGIFRSADGGTVFLDEICEMPVGMQAKLLRFIQERRFIPVGGRDYINVDVRIVAATNKNPLDEIASGNFREDLYYRLLVVPVEVAPLRERKEDIPLLAMHFLETFSSGHNKSFYEFSPEAMKLLINYPWKGNVRELENAIESLVVLNKGSVVYPGHLSPKIWDYIPDDPEAGKVEIQVRHIFSEEKIIPFDEVEKRAIEQAIRACNGNVTKAAKKLRLGTATVYRKIKAYGISA